MNFTFVLLFIFIGFVLGFQKHNTNTLVIMLVIAILWTFVFSNVWGIVTFVELIIGWGIAQAIKENFTN